MSNNDSITVTLTVAYVGHGGNARNGRYFYSYTPDFVKVSEKDTLINYIMDEKSAERFSIDSYALCDPENQMFDIQMKDGELSMKDACTSHNQLIMLAVLVTDNNTGEIIDCDPEVTNVPPPE